MKLLKLAAAMLLSAAAVFAEDPATFSVGAFAFTRPAEWTWVPVNSPMRKAQLKVPGAEPAQSAEIVFFHFGNGGAGGVQANAQRWLRQFESKPGVEKIEPRDLGGTAVTLVSTEGTYNSGMPGGPTTPLADQALLGAILDHADGSVFVKMTGPVALVKASREKFIAFITAAAGAKQ